MTGSAIDRRERVRRSLIRTLGRVHRAVVRVSGGRVLGRVAGMPVLLLTTRGRHSGKQRTVPLTYLRDGVDLVVVGSFGGSDRAPAWWLNLEHDRRAAVQLDGSTIGVSARTADASERARLWPIVIDLHPGYARYQSRTRRRIPIVLLTPTGTHGPLGDEEAGDDRSVESPSASGASMAVSRVSEYDLDVPVDVLTDIEINRPRAEVSSFASDPDNAVSWYENIESVEWKTPKPLAVGSRLRFVARFLGRRLAYTYEVTVLVPGERFVMSTAEGPFPMQTTYTWSDTPEGGTHMTLRNRGEPAGFSKIAAPMMASAMRRANRKDLARLKQTIESHTAP